MNLRTKHDDAGAALRELEPEVARPEPSSPPPLHELPRRRKAVILAVVVALAASVVATWAASRGGEEPAPRPVESPVVPAPTAPAYGPGNPPPLNNTGEDFQVIVRSMSEFENWYLQHDPDPKYVDLLTNPNCDCYQPSVAGMEDLKAKGWRHDSPNATVHKVIVRDRVDANHVAVYEIHEGLPGAIVDAEGRVVRQRQVMPPTGFLIDYVRGSDGRWRTWKIAALGPPGEGWESW